MVERNNDEVSLINGMFALSISTPAETQYPHHNWELQLEGTLHKYSALALIPPTLPSLYILSLPSFPSVAFWPPFLLLLFHSFFSKFLCHFTPVSFLPLSPFFQHLAPLLFTSNLISLFFPTRTFMFLPTNVSFPSSSSPRHVVFGSISLTLGGDRWHTCDLD